MPWVWAGLRGGLLAFSGVFAVRIRWASSILGGGCLAPFLRKIPLNGKVWILASLGVGLPSFSGPLLFPPVGFQQDAKRTCEWDD